MSREPVCAQGGERELPELVPVPRLRSSFALTMNLKMVPLLGTLCPFGNDISTPRVVRLLATAPDVFPSP